MLIRPVRSSGNTVETLTDEAHISRAEMDEIEAAWAATEGG